RVEGGMTTRAFAFMGVGLAGFLVQTLVLAALTLRAHWPVAIATAVGVETAVLTNFFWHERWTWRDRAEAGTRWSRLLRFHLTNGATSLTGNTVLTVVLARVFGLNPIAANIIVVGLLSVTNFLAADRWVFATRAVAIGATLVIAQPSPAAAAE